MPTPSSKTTRTFSSPVLAHRRYGNLHKPGCGREAPHLRRLNFYAAQTLKAIRMALWGPKTGTMDEYLVGPRTLLTAGPRRQWRGRRFTRRPTSSGRDGESSRDRFRGRPIRPNFLGSSSMISGWSRGYFREAVVKPLLARRECSLGEVIGQLARAAGTSEIHLFARWSPEAQMAGEITAAGVRLMIHPFESIERAALVWGQPLSRWRSLLRAA